MKAISGHKFLLNFDLDALVCGKSVQVVTCIQFLLVKCLHYSRKLQLQKSLSLSLSVTLVLACSVGQQKEPHCPLDKRKIDAMVMCSLYSTSLSCISKKLLNKNTRELTSARKMSHKHANKDLSRLR